MKRTIQCGADQKMDRWRNRVAVVTGASSGIGAATLKDLVNAEVIVIGLCRNPVRIDKIQRSLPLRLQTLVHTFKCDVRNEEDVKTAFKWVDDNFGGADILVNCAGIFEFCNLTGVNDAAANRNIFQTNTMGTFFCTREAFLSMKRRNVDGHIVCMNSMEGHKVFMMLDTDLTVFNTYAASKFAITAMVETFRQEFANAGTRIKITSISPGLAHTSLGDNFMSSVDVPVLYPQDISSAILFCLGTPPHVLVQELMIKPIGEVY